MTIDKRGAYLRCVHTFVTTEGHAEFVYAREVSGVMGESIAQTGRVLSDYARDGFLTKRMTGGATPSEYSLTRVGRLLVGESIGGEAHA